MSEPAVVPERGELLAADVERALDEIRPHLHGGVELVAIEGRDVRVRLHGTCAECSMRQLTLQTGVERVLRSRLPEIGAVFAV